MTSFKNLPLAPEMQKALETLGFVQPTEIQSKAIPLLLAQDHVDFHGQAQTGTGKTLAFGIPLLHRINAQDSATQALIVAPTRELALQICDSIKPLAQSMGLTMTTIYGGASMEDQIRTLRRGIHIVVGTPGRLNDHLRRRTLQLDRVKTLVLDEADIMLDMGFKDEVDEILEKTPRTREIWLFSATVKQGINTIMQEHMRDTQSVRVAKKTESATTTKQYYCVVPMRQRLPALCRFIESAPDFYGFIFCQTKVLTSEIAEQLIRLGYKVGALHGDLSQTQRNLVIKKFKNKEIAIVVATDVAARGIDIANLTHVVNYSLPEDHESYVHRIGRTGRAGKEGIAITFINKSEVRLIQLIQRKFNFTIEAINVPSKEHIIASRLTLARTYIDELLTQDIQYDSVKELIADYQAPQLMQILESILYDKFIKSIDQEEDLSLVTPQLSERTAQRDSNIQEFSLSVGLDDGVTQEEVVAHLMKTQRVTADQILKVRVIKRKTFVEVPTTVAQQLVDALRGENLGGRKVRIELIDAEQDRQARNAGRSSSHGGRSGGRFHGGGRRSNDSRSRMGGSRRRSY